MTKMESTFWAKVYLSGSPEIIKQVCRKYCYRMGLCVTLKEVLFIYTGGEEFGVEIGLINYPRFPDTKESLLQKAIELAKLCRDESYQHSYLVMTNEETIWDSTKEQERIKPQYQSCNCTHNESCPSCLP